MGIYDGIPREIVIGKLEQIQGRKFNPEQLELLSNYKEPMISFSDPGTGKTHTVVNGLVVAELCDRIPAKSMTAVSFTRAASGELKDRHKKLCERLGIGSQVNFKTFMGFCLEIIKDNYSKFGWREFKRTQGEMTAEEVVSYFRDTCKYYGVEFEDKLMIRTYNAIKKMNSSLIFDDRHIVNKIEFKRLGITVEQLQFLRKAVYDLNRYSGSITVGDILLYTLELLIKFPEVSNKLKSEIKVLLVDEFQDMSVLQLLLCKLISDNMIAIGDINQQIYSFNGACGLIVQKFKEFYPGAREVRLIQSYRCKQEICDFAYEIVKPNGMINEAPRGISEGGKVELHRGLDTAEIVAKIKVEMDENNNVFQTDQMFLCRNNYSIIPMAEELFQNEVPFRIIPKNDFDTGFPKANFLEVISDLCEVFELARTPYNSSALRVLNKFWPEFSSYKKAEDMPLARIMEEEGCSFLEACGKYDFRDKVTAGIIINALMELDDMYVDRKPIGDMIDLIYPIMYENYFKRRLIYMNEKPEYWLNLISCLRDKSYQKFITDENAKDKWVDKWIKKRYGVRLYTIHGSKGLEADIVHIIDANEGVMPNLKRLKETQSMKCFMDAADNVRNERSLAYVGVTRAKEEVHIYYDNELASIFTGENKFKGLDRIYQTYVDTYDDVGAFKEFIDEDIKEFAKRV